jgi:hypothetical protein
LLQGSGFDAFYVASPWALINEYIGLRSPNSSIYVAVATAARAALAVAGRA